MTKSFTFTLPFFSKNSSPSILSSSSIASTTEIDLEKAANVRFSSLLDSRSERPPIIEPTNHPSNHRPVSFSTATTLNVNSSTEYSEENLPGSNQKKSKRQMLLNKIFTENEIQENEYPTEPRRRALVQVIPYGFIHTLENRTLFQKYEESIRLEELAETKTDISTSQQENSPLTEKGGSSSKTRVIYQEKQVGVQEMDKELETWRSSNKDMINRYITDLRFRILFDKLRDPECPRNWTLKKKMTGTMLNSIASMLAQMGSGIIAPLSQDIQREFGVGNFLISLSSTIFFVGMAFGPLIFAPLSELKGRKYAICISMFIGSLITALAGNARHIGFLLVCRFFWGLAMSAPIVIAGGSISDLWQSGDRAVFMTLNSLSIILGPTTCFLVGTLFNSIAGWRWVIWINGIATFTMMIMIALFSNESFHPVLLQHKAKQIRRETGNNLYHTENDSEKLSLNQIVTVHFYRPIKLLVIPIAFIVCCFNGFSFGLYFMVSIYVPKSFQQLEGWSALHSAFPPISIFVGAVVGAIIHVTISGVHLNKIIRKYGKCEPESRLFLPLCAGWLLPVGMMIYGWGMSTRCIWVVPCFGLVLVGAGFFVILQGSLNYLCDAFPKYSASCIAANTFSRSIFACALPLLAPYLFEGLGIGWGSSVLGGIGFVMSLLVFFIHKYGGRVRARFELKGF